MGIKDPEIGVRAVVRDFEKYLRDLDTVLSRTQKTSDGIAKSVSQHASKVTGVQSTATQAALQALSLLGVKTQQVQQNTVKAVGGITQSIGTLATALKNFAVGGSGSIESLGMALVGLIGPVTAIIGAFAGLMVLGVKGSITSSIEESFSRLAESAKLSADTIIESAHRAAMGLTTDFNIMQQANILMSGQSIETAQKMAGSIDMLLQISRVQARATGGDFDYYFNSLVQGIKRAEPRLIDNLGLIIKVGNATKTFSEKMDVAIQSMSAEQKTQAILDEVLRAGTLSMLTFGDTTEETKQKVEALNQQVASGKITSEEYDAKLKEIAQTMGTAFQNVTAFERFQQMKTSFVDMVRTVGQAVEPLVTAVFGLIQKIAQPILEFIDYVAPAFAAVFTALAPLIEFVGSVIAGIVGPILKFVGGVLTGIAKGIIWIGGVIATAILWVANHLIFPAVISILETLASWLEGHSPPVAGPLKDIDKGAAAVMESWLSGFTGVSLDPVTEVVTDINNLMGEVTGFNRDQVESAIKALDEALRPFDERLRLVKATFEELKAPIEAAFRAIDRQMEVAVKAMLQGDTEAAALVRQLDAQRQALQEYTDAQQEAIDNAEIQLAYVKAQQALEREILEIQQERLGPEEKEKKIKEAKAKAAKEETGGKAQPAAAVPSPAGIGGEAPPFGMEKNVQSFIDEALGAGGLGSALKEQQAAADENAKKISTLGTRIEAGFSNFGTRIGDSIKRALGIAIDDKELQKKLEEFGISASGFISTGIDQSTLSGAVSRLISRVGSGKDFGIAVGTLSSKALTQLTDDISRGDVRLKEALVALVGHVATSDQLKFINDTLGQGFTNQFMLAVSDDKNPESLATKLGQFWDPKSKTWKENPDKAIQTVIDAVKEGFVTKSRESLDEFDTRIILTTNTNLPGALRTIDGDLTEMLVNPLGVAVIKTTENLTTMDNAFDKSRLEHINPMTNAIKLLTLSITGKDGLKEAMESLQNMGNIPKTPATTQGTGTPKGTNTFFNPLPKAGGGSVTGEKEYIIGEYGPERLRLPAGVNGWIDSTSQMMHRYSQDPLRALFPSLPYPSVALGGNTTTDDHSTSYGDIIFNGVRDSSQAMRRFSMLRMMRR